MKKALLLVFVFGMILAGCSRPIGPLIVNATGETVEIEIEYSDGHRIAGRMEAQMRNWSGRPDSHVVSISFRVGPNTSVVNVEALISPFPGEKWAALAVQKHGIEKIRYKEAETFSATR